MPVPIPLSPLWEEMSVPIPLSPLWGEMSRSDRGGSDLHHQHSHTVDVEAQPPLPPASPLWGERGSKELHLPPLGESVATVSVRGNDGRRTLRAERRA